TTTAACGRSIASRSSIRIGGRSERREDHRAADPRGCARAGRSAADTRARLAAPDRARAVGWVGADPRGRVRAADRLPARARVDGGRQLAAGVPRTAGPAGLRPAEPRLRPVLVPTAVPGAARRARG